MSMVTVGCVKELFKSLKFSSYCPKSSERSILDLSHSSLFSRHQSHFTENSHVTKFYKCINTFPLKIADPFEQLLKM